MTRIQRILVSASALVICGGAFACAALTPQAKADIANDFALACPAEALIPDVGPWLVAACPAEDAAVSAALNGTPEVGTFLLVSNPANDGGAGTPTARVLRRMKNGTTAQIGHGVFRAAVRR